MKLIRQNHEILAFPHDALHLIEIAGRTCYRSEPKGDPGRFVKMLRDKGHHSVLEHANATVRMTTMRSVTHELVRHRLASYSQASQRYIRYDGEIEFILPCWWMTCQSEQRRDLFAGLCREAERIYQRMLSIGCRPEEAREVLPNATATTIVMTANFREWMHVFRLRTGKAAHPQIRDLILGVQADFAKRWPALFGTDTDADIKDAA